MPYPEKQEFENMTGSDIRETFELESMHFEIFIDCHEQEVQIPSDKLVHRAFWSEYKQRTTLKFLGAISGNGAFVFCSTAYPGRITDPKLTKLRGLLDLIHIDGVVSADKGFMMHSEFVQRGAYLAVPPKAMAGQHAFSHGQMADTAKIARLRIHVERAFERAQEFKILHNAVPVTMIDLWGDIFKVCCYLTNYQAPLIRDKHRGVPLRYFF